MFISYACYASVCPYCNGTGRIKKRVPSTSSFGTSQSRWRCPECHATSYDRHIHTRCTHCRGTGQTGRGSSSSGSSSSGLGHEVTDEVSANAFIALHGPKLTVEEQRTLSNFRSSKDSRVPAFNKWYSKLVSQYISWRDDLDIYKMYKFSTERDLTAKINARDKFYTELNAIKFSVPSNMTPVVNSLRRQLDSTWKELLEKTQYAVQCNRDQQMLEYYQLNPEAMPEVINIHIQ